MDISDVPQTKLVNGDEIQLTEEERKQILSKIETERPTLNEAQQNKISDIKDRANSILSKTDWYIVREQETGEAIPQDVFDHRSEVRSLSDRFETEVNSLATVDEVLNYSYEFPDPPQP